MYQVDITGGCEKCGGNLYPQNPISFLSDAGIMVIAADYTCRSCGKNYYGKLTPDLQAQTNGNETNKKGVNLEDKCMLIFRALSENENGLALTTIARYTDTKASASMKKYLEIMQMGGYVSTNNENGAGNETFKITPEGRTVFREYEGLIAIVEDEAQVTFNTYRFFDTRGRLTKFGLFVKDVAEKTPEQYSRLGEFINKINAVFSLTTRTRKSSSGGWHRTG